MSAKHPTPWTIEDGDNGKRGKARAEWAYILDARGVYVVDGMDCATAREIAEAVNGRAALRDLVRRLADNLRRYHINGERDTALLKEAREALEEAPNGQA
jgi:hypothetical protein